MYALHTDTRTYILMEWRRKGRETHNETSSRLRLYWNWNPDDLQVVHSISVFLSLSLVYFHLYRALSLYMRNYKCCCRLTFWKKDQKNNNNNITSNSTTVLQQFTCVCSQSNPHKWYYWRQAVRSHVSHSHIRCVCVCASTFTCLWVSIIVHTDTHSY